MMTTETRGDLLYLHLFSGLRHHTSSCNTDFIASFFFLTKNQSEKDWVDFREKVKSTPTQHNNIAYFNLRAT